MTLISCTRCCTLCQASNIPSKSASLLLHHHALPKLSWCNNMPWDCVHGTPSCLFAQVIVSLFHFGVVTSHSRSQGATTGSLGAACIVSRRQHYTSSSLTSIFFQTNLLKFPNITSSSYIKTIITKSFQPKFPHLTLWTHFND